MLHDYDCQQKQKQNLFFAKNSGAKDKIDKILDFFNIPKFFLKIIEFLKEIL